MSQWAIETMGLGKRVATGIAVQPLDLRIAPGHFFGLVGPNGAGKSLLLRMLMGAVKPSSGTATIFGMPIDDPNEQARDQIGYVADHVALYPALRVRELVDWYAAMYTRWDHKYAEQLVRDFQLPMQQRVSTLSKGKLKQLRLLLALSSKPRLLLLDEPTDGLDVVMQRFVWQLLLQQMVDRDTTILCATHDLHQLENLADHLGVMFQGALLVNENVAELKANARHVHVIWQQGAPTDLHQWPGVVQVEPEGQGVSLTVCSHWQEVLAQIERAQPAYLDVSDLDLSELFHLLMRKEGYVYDSLGHD